MRELGGAGIGGEDLVEVGGQSASRLSVAGAAIPCQGPAGREGGQLLEERRWIAGPGAGIGRRAGGEVVLESHRILMGSVVRGPRSTPTASRPRPHRGRPASCEPRVLS